MPATEIIIATIAHRVLELRDAAKTDLSSRASAADVGASVAGVSAVAAPLALPILGMASLVGAKSIFQPGQETPPKKLDAQSDKKLYNDDISLDDIAIRKAVSDATISELIREAANVPQFRGGMPPSSRLEGDRYLVGRSESVPLKVCTSSSFADRITDFVMSNGGLCKTDEEFRDLMHTFAETELKEELKVLTAAMKLREEFHLTPKPDIRWGQRKKLGADTTVANVLDEHAPDLPFRNKTLSELSEEEWWEAFYEEDAIAGRISDAKIGETDQGFRIALSKTRGLKTLGTLMTAPDTEKKRSQLAQVLGTENTAEAQRFMIPGNNRKERSTDTAKQSVPRRA